MDGLRFSKKVLVIYPWESKQWIPGVPESMRAHFRDVNVDRYEAAVQAEANQLGRNRGVPVQIFPVPWQSSLDGKYWIRRKLVVSGRKDLKEIKDAMDAAQRKGLLAMETTMNAFAEAQDKVREVSHPYRRWRGKRKLGLSDLEWLTRALKHLWDD